MKIEIKVGTPKNTKMVLRDLRQGQIARSRSGDHFIRLAGNEIVNLNYQGYTNQTPGITGNSPETEIEILPAGTTVTLTAE